MDLQPKLHPRVQVRLATLDEAPIVHRIMIEAFEEFRDLLDPPSGAHLETVEDVRAGLTQGGGLLAFLEGEPVGSARFAPKGDYVYLGRLAVLPSARRLGVAGAMLRFLEDVTLQLGFGEIRLSTREVMESNLRLYERHGYRLVGRAPHPRGSGIVVDFAKRLA